MFIPQESELQRILDQHGDKLAAGATAVLEKAPEVALRLGLRVYHSVVVTVMKQVRGACVLIVGGSHYLHWFPVVHPDALTQAQSQSITPT